MKRNSGCFNDIYDGRNRNRKYAVLAAYGAAAFVEAGYHSRVDLKIVIADRAGNDVDD